MTEIIAVDKLSKTYLKKAQKFYALKEISFTVNKGDIFGIIGLSGAGKSTLIKALSTLIEPSSGHIFFHGKEISSMQKGALSLFRKKMGMIFQHFNLLNSRTVFENIAYPLEIANVSLEERMTRVENLLEWVGLEKKRESYPSELSGGEKQRVAIARALANNPEILFCDEATSALDPKTTKEILALLNKIHKNLGITIVLITHEMGVVKEICNKVAVLEKGEIVEQGTVIDLFANPRHPTTQNFLKTTSHDIPVEFFKNISPNSKILRLSFKGEVSGEPVISEIVRKFNVDSNILLGWIDRLQNLAIGVLVIELRGSPEGISDSLNYFKQKKVDYEVLCHEPR